MEGLDSTRNIGIIAHIDAGKTTTTERFLFYSGKTYKVGNVDEGTAVMDWFDQERERGITIFSAATTCSWNGYKINIIDTPGHVDFTVEVERSLRVLDGVVGIFCAVGGVQPQSETVWRQSDKYGIPRIIYINKMDRTGADFFKVIKEIRNKLDCKPLLMNMPIMNEEGFAGIVDILKEKAYFYNGEDEKTVREQDVPESMRSLLEEHRDILIEKAADVDNNIMEKYLSGEEITVPELKSAVRKGTVGGMFFPVFCGSSLKNKGTTLLLNAVTEYLPSPLDRGSVKGFNPLTKKEQLRKCDTSEHFSAYLFKVYNEPRLGKLFYARIYSGTLKKGQSVYNWGKKCSERIMRIFEMHANRTCEKDEASAGDIVVLTGLRQSCTGDTLSEKKAPVVFEQLKFPEPVIYVAVEPKVKSDQEKIYANIARVAEEDPTVKLKTDEETGQIIMMGMGELHLQVIVERIKREYKTDIRMGKPEVAYRETILHAATGEGKFIKQSGGRGQYGHVTLNIEPLPRGGKFVFENQAGNDKIPSEFISSVEEGVREAMENGPMLGTPVMDVKVIVTGGSYHPVDSSEIAYKIAGSMAFGDAVKKAGPAALEPIMKIEVSTPEEFLGEVLADINQRHCKIVDMVTDGKIKIVKGQIPLRTVFGYATVLRSLTQGRGNYIIEPLHYEFVPEDEIKRLTGS